MADNGAFLGLIADGTCQTFDCSDRPLTLGRGHNSFLPDIRLQAPADSIVDVSAVALEIFCHSTNLAVRVYQRPPGYLVAEVTDTFTSRPVRHTVSAPDTLLSAGPQVALTLRLGDGPAAADIAIGSLSFQPAPPNPHATGYTKWQDQSFPREQWVRWLVSAHRLWKEDRELVAAGHADPPKPPSQGLPSEARVREQMRERFHPWPTTHPAEPRRAVAEALHHYGFDPVELNSWQAGLRALFSQGWPRQSLIDWTEQTKHETGCTPVGLGGRQGPRLP